MQHQAGTPYMRHISNSTRGILWQRLFVLKEKPVEFLPTYELMKTKAAAARNAEKKAREVKTLWRRLAENRKGIESHIFFLLRFCCSGI